MSFGEINSTARQVAGALDACEERSARIILAMPPGPDYFAAFFGCLYAGLLPVPAPIPSGRRSSDRTARIAAECGAASIICDARAEGAVAAAGLTPRVLAELAGGSPRDPRPADLGDTAYLQFTSGSTGTPRGVMVSHGAALANLAALGERSGELGEGWSVSWLPLHHDMGLLTGLFAIQNDLGLAIMAPGKFRLRPWSWLEAISRYRAIFSGAPAFAYDLLSRQPEPSDAAPLDLSRWSVAFCGAEPIRPAVLRRFARRFAAAGLQPNALSPSYGLAEFTLVAAASSPSEPVRATPTADLNGAVKEVCDLGPVIAGHRLRIVDPDTLLPLRDGVVGEVLLDGPSKGSGYWNRPRETRATFAAKIAGESGTFLRTGDLGFVEGGRLHVVGRRKELLIVRGRNIHPIEVEEAVRHAHPALRTVAAFPLAEGGIGLMCEFRRTGSAHEVIAAIQRELGRLVSISADLIALVRSNVVPRTTSGKIRRLACESLLVSAEVVPVMLWRAKTDVARLRTERTLPDSVTIRGWLLSYLADRLGLDSSAVDETAALETLGLDSMGAVDLACALEDWLRLPLEGTLIWQAPTLGRLCDYLALRVREVVAAPIAVCSTGDLALSRIEILSDSEVHALHSARLLGGGG